METKPEPSSLLDLDLEDLDISDFLDETTLSGADDIANVMAASCTTCECSCSVSTALVEGPPVEASAERGAYFSHSVRTIINQRASSAAFSDASVRTAEAEWPKVISAMREYYARGADPSSPEVRNLARRWKELTDQFTGGSEAVSRSAARLYANEAGVLQEIFGADRIPDADLVNFVRKSLVG